MFFSNEKKSKLCGILSNPTEKKNAPIIVMAHGFAGTKNNRGNSTLSELLNLKKVSTFRFDFYGHGDSDGKFEDITVSEGVNDVICAISFLKKQGYKKIGLMGSSFGGICSTIAASKSPELFVLALKSPVSDYPEVESGRKTKKDISDWKKTGFAVYDKEKNLNLNYSFYEDITKLDVYKDAEKIKIPTIIVHGDKDEIVPVTQSFKLVKSIKTSKLVVVKGANHRYEDKKDFDTVIKLISEFIIEKTKAIKK